MRKLLITLIAFTFTACNSPENHKNDIYNEAMAEGFKGPVKQIISTTYLSTVEDFGEWRPANDSFALKNIQHYDIHGRSTGSKLINISATDYQDTTKSIFHVKNIETDSGAIAISNKEGNSGKFLKVYKKINDSTWLKHTYNEKKELTSINQITLNAKGMKIISETKHIDPNKEETASNPGAWRKYMYYYDEEDHLQKEIFELKQPAEYYNTNMYKTVKSDTYGNKLTELEYIDGKPEIIRSYEYTYYE